MPLLSALLAVHAYSAPLAGRPAVTRAAAGAITMGGNQKVVGFDDVSFPLSVAHSTTRYCSSG